MYVKGTRTRDFRIMVFSFISFSQGPWMLGNGYFEYSWLKIYDYDLILPLPLKKPKVKNYALCLHLIQMAFKERKKTLAIILYTYVHEYLKVFSEKFNNKKRLKLHNPGQWWRKFMKKPKVKNLGYVYRYGIHVLVILAGLYLSSSPSRLPGTAWPHNGL